MSIITDFLEWPLKNGVVLHSRYKIIGFIGKGSYGLAYRAVDHMTDEIVVVKQSRRRKSKLGKRMFEREAKILSELNHPAIPKFIDLFVENQKTFLVMDFVDGKNIEELIFYEGQTFNEQESFQILMDVLIIIQYLHEKRMIHRDLRLPNILIRDQKVWVIDFGLAVYLDEGDSVLVNSTSREKRMYREVSVTSDFYALGHFVLFLLYSNYQSSSKKEFSWEEELNLGKEANRIIRKLLQLNSCYENANEIMEDIEGLLKGVIV